MSNTKYFSTEQASSHMADVLLKDFFSQLNLEKAQVHKNLCVFPILNGSDSQPNYVSLKTALENGHVEITEINKEGHVPYLKATNKGTLPVLILDGEELKGAKQNRVVNTSILLAPNSEKLIPVSCSERGRWSYNSPSFSYSGAMMSSKLRYRKSERVRQNIVAKNSFEAEQSMVWNDVESLHKSSGSFHLSRTRAMRDAYTSNRDKLKDYLQDFPILPNQKGLIVFMDGNLAGADFVSRSDVYTDLHENLLKSHILEAIASKKEIKLSEELVSEAKEFLKTIGDFPLKENDAVDLGQDYRFNGAKTSGAALTYSNTLVHLTAFSKDMIGKNPRSRRF